MYYRTVHNRICIPCDPSQNPLGFCVHGIYYGVALPNNIYASLLNRRIVWRGIVYEMISSRETRIIRPNRAAAETNGSNSPG